MDLGLKNKTAIVMASSAGLGKAVATELAREGANIMISSRREDELKKVQAEIAKETGNEPAYTAADITNYDDIKNVVNSTVEKFGGVDILVNNAGGPPAGTFDKFDDEAWLNAINLNLLSYIRSIREVVPHMKKAGQGWILNCTSSGVKQALPNLILSNTCRMGVVGLSKTLCNELGSDNIRINVLAPGRIWTDRIAYLDGMRAEKMGVTLDEIKASTKKSISLGRYGDPAEFGRTAAFLCSGANTYTSGQTILVDGGLTTAY